MQNQFIYKYNAKELQIELGLNWYDYGARNYDVALGRWMNLDPLAENYTKFSPFVYVANNPLLFVDKDGNRIIIGDNTSQAMVLLAKIAATEKGNVVIKRLVKSNIDYTLQTVFLSRNSGLAPYKSDYFHFMVQI